MNLFEINSAIENFEFKVDEETGEILNISDLDNLELEKNTKIENIALFIKNLKANEKALDDEYKAMYARKKATVNKRQSLEKYLAKALDCNKFETPKCKLSFRKSTQVDVDEDFINWALKNRPELVKTDIVQKPIKKDIMKALKDNEELEHCSLRYENNLQIK